MITVNKLGGYFRNGEWLTDETAAPPSPEAKNGSIAAGILNAHSTPGLTRDLRLTFDALASHDLTFVGVILTARASGMREFPMPYVLTNCHNSLCAVGGTINEDDHLFGLSAAKKYGGIYVPPHIAVIHQYVREMIAGCGKMVLGSDSHTRSGALGTLSIGEGGPELVKQLVGKTYDIPRPDIAAVHLTGSPRPGVGPQDVALALIKAVFPDGLVTNKILEFIGSGVSALSVDYRLGIDVMTTETACLSSIWETDDAVREFLEIHGRGSDYACLRPRDGAWYDMVVHLDLGAVEPMIALPFHPSNAFTIRECNDNAADMLAAVEKEAATMLREPRTIRLRDKIRDGRLHVDQAIIAGCSGGTYENLVRAATILKGCSTGDDAFALSVYPASQPQYLELMRNGHIATLMEAGATIRTAFCGPCFGAGDVPGNQGLSIRHTTRNFPSREGSKPGDGQLAYVALMDARSIAATARHKGRLTPATELEDILAEGAIPYTFDNSIYANRIYSGWGNARPEEDLLFGPNIADWPAMPPLPENLLLTVGAAIFDPVTTTDELIPSGETSSYRSNPHKLAEFTLSRRDPAYVGRAKAAHRLEQMRVAEHPTVPEELAAAYAAAGTTGENTGLGTVVFCLRPGDGSAREQAASCQKVLGTWANIAGEYATKRYRSNVINWGMLPFETDNAASLAIMPDDVIHIPGIRTLLEGDGESVTATIMRNGEKRSIELRLPALSRTDRDIILAGCLMNFYALQGPQE